MEKSNHIIGIDRLGMAFQRTDGSSPLHVLRNLSLGVYENEFLAIIGPSGCGKSTLLKLIGDLMTPTEGKILIEGDLPSNARKKRKISFVFQNPVILDWRTVLTNIQLPGEIFHDETTKNRAQELVELVGLTGFENAYPRQLSGGMQSRVAIARALSFNPSILLMDESFGDLDELTRTKMNLELLRIWHKTKATVIFVTHSIQEAVFLSDRVAVMTPRPSRIKKILNTNLPRPRNVEDQESEEFIKLTRILREEMELEF